MVKFDAVSLAMESRKEAVVELERNFWEKGHDPDFFKENSLDNSISVIESMGFVNQADAVKMSEGAKPWKNVKMQDMHVLDLNDDTMALAYHGEGTQDGMEKPYRATISSVYIRRNGKWKLALTSHQGWDKSSG